MADSQVIARRFRPKTFDQVVGQEAIMRTLTNALASKRIHHAYLFTGARGVGKTTTARILAKALNCVKGISTEPCNECDSCREIAASGSIDVHEMDAASHTQVDNIREVILNTIAISPARDRYKIFIIDEVHQLSGHAFNALLKTLEEPPPHVAFIMATTELQKVPDTILSRCQVFEFRTITNKKIYEQLRRIADDLRVEISETALMAIARAGEGSMRDAESALDQVISFAGDKVADEDVSVALGLVDLETLNTTLRAIASEDAGKVLEMVDEVVSRGYDLRNFCRELMVHTRALLVTKIAGVDNELVQMPQSEGESLKRIADAFSEQDLVRFFSILTKTEQDIRLSSQPRFQLEMGLIKLVHARKLYLLEDALTRLNDLESRLAGLGSLPAAGSPVAVPAAPAPSPRPSRTRPVESEPGPPPRPAPRAEPPPAGRQAGSSKPAPVGPPRPAARSLPDEPPAFDEPYETEPQLPPVAARAPAGAGNIEGAVEKIKSLIEARRKMILLSALDKAEMKVDGDFLRINYGPGEAMFKGQIESRENRKTLEEVSRQVLGRQVGVSVTVGGSATAEVTPQRKETADIKEQAEKHPAVRAIVEKFHGEVVDVVKPES